MAGGSLMKSKMAFVLIALSVFAGFMLFGCTGEGEPGIFTKKPSLSEKKEVTLDYLYADWCPHCQKMKPYVAKLAATLPQDRFLVRAWNEADRSSSPDSQKIYTDYQAKGYFQGFPTFVLNENDYRVGEMPEPQLKAFVCSKFKAPAPAACSAG